MKSIYHHGSPASPAAKKRSGCLADGLAKVAEAVEPASSSSSCSSCSSSCSSSPYAGSPMIGPLVLLFIKTYSGHCTFLSSEGRRSLPGSIACFQCNHDAKLVPDHFLHFAAFCHPTPLPLRKVPLSLMCMDIQRATALRPHR